MSESDPNINQRPSLIESVPASLQESGIYTVEGVPHVHGANLTVLDRNGVPDNAPESMKVFVAHGFKGKKNRWVLADGREVTDVIKDYNDNHSEDPIRFAAVCNPTKGVDRKMDNVGYAANSDMQVSGFMEDSQVHLRVKLKNPDDGVFFLPHGDTTKMVIH